MSVQRATRRQTAILLVLLGAFPTYHYRGGECAGGGGGVVLASADVADLHDQCGTLAARGGCTVSPDWMGANCPKSCSSGGGATTAAPPPPAAPPPAAEGPDLSGFMTDPATPLPAEFIDVRSPDDVAAHTRPPFFIIA